MRTNLFRQWITRTEKDRDKIMFPHATCLCVKAAQKNVPNCEARQHQSHNHNYQQHHQENCDRKKSPTQSKENSWIIQRHVNFVKINVLSPLQASSILRHSQHQLYNREVSLFSHFIYADTCTHAHTHHQNPIYTGFVNARNVSKKS